MLSNMAIREADRRKPGFNNGYNSVENKGQKDLVSVQVNRYLLKCGIQIFQNFQFLLAVFLAFLQVFSGNYVSQKPKIEVF